MDRRHFLAATAGLAAGALLSTPARAVTGKKTITDLAVATPELSTLVAAVTAAGLGGALAAPGSMTVFAPTNDAFDKLPAGTVDALLNDIPTLTKILTYHVSGSYYPAEALLGQRGRVPTLEGSYLHVDATGSAVKINSSTTVTAANIFASNGVVHLIDSVLLP